ncbi:glycosyltransferase [Vibrio superstes]|uniref:glycosyltransferase n=1 Tax=Vibrio superstes TaxID=198815 RepID=UPI000E5B0134
MLSISIVTYKNSIDEIKNCLSPILNCASIDTICIYDNSETSPVKSEDVIKLGTNIIYYSDKRNLGYGYGHNHAFELCQTRKSSKYHLVMNLDVQVDRNTLLILIEYMDRSPKTLHCMPKVLNPDHSIQHTCKLIPSPLNLILRRFAPSMLKVLLNQSSYELHDYNFNYVLNCPYLSGCFMFLRSNTFRDVGKFDTRFFMYPEDIDLTRRLHTIGKTECYPFVSIIHQHEKASYNSWRMTWVHIRSMIKYFNKWGWFIDIDRNIYNSNLKRTISKHRNI